MSKKIKAEYIILKKSKMFMWVSVIFVVLIWYNISYVATESQKYIIGGYYTYCIMLISFLLGIIFPMMLGSFLGGFDAYEGMRDYQIVNRNIKDYILIKIILMLIGNASILAIVSLMGIVIDMYKHTFMGGMGENITIFFKRYIVLLVVWIWWSCISFVLSYIINDNRKTIAITLTIYFGEQYIGQFINLKYGMIWNLKSIMYRVFADKEVAFQIIQSDYNDSYISYIYIFAILIVVFCILVFDICRRYPTKLKY